MVDQVVHELNEAVARLEKECLEEYSSALSGNPQPRRVLRHAQQMLGYVQPTVATLCAFTGIVLRLIYAFTGIVLRLIYVRSLALRITVGTIAAVGTSVFNGLVASVY